MADMFFADGLRFSCKRCSHCCGGEPGYVYLSEQDFMGLLEFFKMSPADFEKKFCRWVGYYDGSEVLCLQEKKNYDCILWQDGCSAYEKRPIQCSTYPFWTCLLKSREEWLSEKSNCPGIDSGEMHKLSEITEKVISYERNVPIKKSEFADLVQKIEKGN